MSKMSMFNNTQYLYSPTLTENNYTQNPQSQGNMFSNERGLSTVQHSNNANNNFLTSPDSNMSLIMPGLT